MIDFADITRSAAAAVFFVAAAPFFVAGWVGSLRLTDAYSRLHAVRLMLQFGAPLAATGLAIKAGTIQTAACLALLALLFLGVGPLASHLLVNAVHDAARKS